MNQPMSISCLWLAAVARPFGPVTIAALFTAAILVMSQCFGNDEAATKERAATAEATENDSRANLEAISALIRDRRFEEAVRLANEAIKQSPEDRDAHAALMLVIESIVAETSQEELIALREIVDVVLSGPMLETRSAITASSAVDRLLRVDATLSADDKLELLDRLEEKLPDENRLAGVEASVLRRRVSTLLAAGRVDEAGAVLDKMIETRRANATPGDSQSVRRFVNAVSTYRLLVGRLFADRADELLNEAESLTAEAMGQDEIDMTAVINYFGLRHERALLLATSDPRAALTVIEEIERALASAYERLDRVSIPALSTYTRTLASLRGNVVRSLKVTAVPGSEAPEIDADSFIGREPVTMAELRGKVVMIHFFAVWCEPCIETFPQLIRLHEQMSERGLVILGATRYYGYRWDDETQRPEKGSNVSHEQELEMLERFREFHRLRHGLFVTPNTGSYQNALAVIDVPHDVLIDRNGKVQLFRGRTYNVSDEEFADKVEQLLAEDVTADR